jgi:hypothetical protein
MPIDESVWTLLRERTAAGRAASRADPAGGAASRADLVDAVAHRAARVRLLGAAADVLAATRTLIAALEDDLRERRDQLATNPAPGIPEPDPPAPAGGAQRTDIDLSY